MWIDSTALLSILCWLTIASASTYVAVVNRGHRIVQFVADHEFQDTSVFDQIVQTFEFSR